MKSKTKKNQVAVTSRSFSKHSVLREELLKKYPDAKFNDEGLSLSGDSLVSYLAVMIRQLQHWKKLIMRLFLNCQN